jgi:hypothetical protein
VGLYYSKKSPPDIEAIRSWAETISVPNRPPTVVGYYKWGPWVNGGAWIQTTLGKLDLLYRNIEQVQRVIDESQEGLYHHDYYQQPTFGFVSITYLAEIKCCLPLFDPQHLLQKLKRSVENPHGLALGSEAGSSGNVVLLSEVSDFDKESFDRLSGNW